MQHKHSVKGCMKIYTGNLDYNEGNSVSFNEAYETNIEFLLFYRNASAYSMSCRKFVITVSDLWIVVVYDPNKNSVSLFVDSTTKTRQPYLLTRKMKIRSTQQPHDLVSHCRRTSL